MTPEGPRTITVDPSRLRPIVLTAALGVGVLAGLYAQAHSDEWLFFRQASSFGESDPILGYDVGFYVFRLPFLEFAQSFGLLLAGVALIGSGIVYVMSNGIGMDPSRGIQFSDRAVRTSRCSAPWCS